MRLSRSARTVLGVITGVVLAIIYLPLLIVFVNSFSTSKTFLWPPPGLTAEQLASVPNAMHADFGGEMLLLGYQFSPAQAAPGETVHLTLYWQAEILMDRNWSIFVHVVDDAGVIVAQRDRYPAAGTLATTLLQPGQTFADEYVIVIPDAAYAPARAVALSHDPRLLELFFGPWI